MANVMPPQSHLPPNPPHPSFAAAAPPPRPDDGRPSLPPSHAAVSAARRPSRKSTLTQQQKNQKRQRATQDQLVTLEMEFNKNPTPTALVRERIAQEINMTERSVQIWFQNRRAKIKNIAKRSIESGEDCDSIPDSMRQYLAMQAYGPGGKGLPVHMMGGAPGFPAYNAGLMLTPDTSTGKVVIQHFACRSLSVGSWRRVGQSTMDLVIFYSPDKACITYYINNDNNGYKIEYPFAWIKNISLEQGDVLAAAEGASQRSGGLVIELNRPPKFYMDNSGSGGFYECGDFTEDQQATHVMVHHLGGPSKVLSGQLAKLVSLEAYQNRHNAVDPSQFAPAASAPVSPLRPASQPNHMMHPHHHLQAHLLPPDSAAGLMGPPAPRGHKRQRSRSVPAAIDGSMLRHPMPSFLIQHEQQHQPQHQPPPPHMMHDPNIFAPAPQHGHPPGFGPPPPPPLGPGLSIDTSARYHPGHLFNGPVSATTMNSPSEYGTPAFFTSGPPGDPKPAPFATPYHGGGFLQVDPAAMIGTSNTPLSMTSHGDPVIADHSPPLNGVGRSQSADLFGTPGENSQFGDDGLYLSESFHKQIQLPFRSPFSDEPFHSPMPNGSFDLQSPPGTSGSQVALPLDGGQPPHYDAGAPPPPHSQGDMVFQSPPAPHGSQQHQDSGVAFSTTPSNVPPQDPSMMFPSPKDTGMLYQDAKVYSSPGQMHPLSDEQQQQQNPYRHSPLGSGTPGTELDMSNLGMYATIDPTSLGRHHSQ